MFKQRSFKVIFRNRWKILLIIGLFFIIYQLSLFTQLTDIIKKHNLHKGIHEKQSSFYVPNEENMFGCIESGEKIPFNRLNDNYCDCLDGSDEPGTNACPNGLFYCKHQRIKIDRKIRNFIPSSMVNDGICDCCDGSDEWQDIVLPFRLTGKILILFPMQNFHKCQHKY